MPTRLFRILTSFLMFAAAAVAPPAPVRSAGWVLLAEHPLAFEFDRDYIPVTVGGGPVVRLRIEIERHEVFVDRIEIVGAGGRARTFTIGRPVAAGDRAVDIDLREPVARVTELVISYRPRPGFDGRALVRVLAEVAPPGSAWERQRPPEASRETIELDSQRVDLRNDQFILFAERSDAPLSTIAVQVRGAAVFVRRVLVVHASGETREAGIGALIEPGMTTEPIPVDPAAGPVREVVVATRPREGFARLVLVGTPEMPPERWRGEPGGFGPGQNDLGRRVQPPPPTDSAGIPAGRWLLLGSERVGQRGDRDTVRVGGRAGRLRSIALRVLGAGIWLREIEIVYASGERETLPVDREIPAGTLTPALLLAGQRFVERIEMVYQALPEGRGRATVDVYGEAAEPARWSRP